MKEYHILQTQLNYGPNILNRILDLVFNAYDYTCFLCYFQAKHRNLHQQQGKQEIIFISSR